MSPFFLYQWISVTYSRQVSFTKSEAMHQCTFIGIIVQSCVRLFDIIFDQEYLQLPVLCLYVALLNISMYFCFERPLAVPLSYIKTVRAYGTSFVDGSQWQWSAKNRLFFKKKEFFDTRGSYLIFGVVWIPDFSGMTRSEEQAGTPVASFRRELDTSLPSVVLRTGCSVWQVKDKIPSPPWDCHVTTFLAMTLRCQIYFLRLHSGWTQMKADSVWHCDVIWLWY